jgi:hypothetical protein
MIYFVEVRRVHDDRPRAGVNRHLHGLSGVLRIESPPRDIGGVAVAGPYFFHRPGVGLVRGGSGKNRTSWAEGKKESRERNSNAGKGSVNDKGLGLGG